MKQTKRSLLVLSVSVAAAYASAGTGVVTTPKGFPGNLTEAMGSKFSAAQVVSETTPPVTAASVEESTLNKWHEAALTATGLDHTAVRAGESRTFGEQLGPLRAARAMAIVHIAIYDAVVAYTGGYNTYASVAPPASGAPLSMRAAIDHAAHDSLVAMFPSQRASFDALLAQQTANNREPLDAVANGVALGQRAAAAILALRENDGSAHAEPRYGVDFIASTEPGKWRQDPVSRVPIAMGAKWASVKPFVIRSADQFRLPPPPAYASAAFINAYNEIKAKGGDGVTTSTTRSERETKTGIFWAYDGVPSLCAPPRLYNQLATAVDSKNPRFHSNDWIVWKNPAMQTHKRVVDMVRYMALINTAMADAGLAAWDSKFHYQVARPVTLLREGVAGTSLAAQPDFTPLGAPASNLNGPNFTPPFPSYPSGHATFGGALFQVMRRLKGGDYNSFSLVSDELNGQTRDNTGAIRPYEQRSYVNFTGAEKENGRSRVYLGIHWDFDSTAGISQGNKVGEYVYANAFRPAPVKK